VLLQKLTNNTSRRHLALKRKSIHSIDITNSLLHPDIEGFCHMLLKMDDISLRNAISDAVHQNPDNIKEILFSLNEEAVEILTSRLENMEGTEEQLETFYQTLFSVVPDRKSLVDQWLDKKELFAKRMFEHSLIEIIGYK